MFRLATARLDLIGADGPLLRADSAGVKSLATAVDAQVPTNWPPEHHDQGVIEWVLRSIDVNAPADPWHFYYLLLRDPRTLVGTCGFKGAPDADGRVEVGYSVLEQFRCRGLATEAVAALIRAAFAAGASEVAAETYPSLLPSLRVMEKCGMIPLGAGSEPGTVRHGLRKSTFVSPDG
ncbi:MAG TPA: GNAT family N-acetyltransferase [Steroidobacteraceae bacterium]|nr:GNAT family N-acetyltransferase [Steroidobacteraceae bacterium]